MAIYYPPPGPHVGGRQPYEARELPPSITAVQVDDPPFARKLPSHHSSWWEVYVPQQLRQSSPGVFSAAAVDNPPFGRQPAQTYSAWTVVAPLPQLAERLPPSLLDVRVDDPPFSRRKNPQFHQAWWETYAPQPFRESSPGTFGTAPQVDNPPFGQRAQSYAAWITVYAAPQLPDKIAPALLDVRVDNPPFGKQFQPFYAAHWAPPPAPTQRSDGDISAGIPGLSVDLPPSARSTVPSSTWWIVPPTPTQLRDLAPGIPGQSVDDPPRSRPQTPPAPAPVPFYDLERRYLVQPFVAQAADSAPFSIVWQTIVRSWQYDPGAPRLPRLLNPSITAVQVDDPPRLRVFVLPPVPPVPLQVQYPKLAQDGGAAPAAPDQPYARELLALRWWTVQAPPLALPRLLSPGVPGQSADSPPGPPPAQPGATHWEQRRPIVVSSQLSPGVPGQSVDLPPPLAARQQSWRDGLYPATQPRPTVPGAAADFPPATQLDSGWSVAHWFAPYVAPQRSRPLSAALLAVRVDDPPFDARRLGRLASQVARAQIPYPDRVYLRYVVQEGPALVLGSVICGSIVIRPALSAAFAASPTQSGSTIVGPALSGEPDVEECD